MKNATALFGSSNKAAGTYTGDLTETKADKTVTLASPAGTFKIAYNTKTEAYTYTLSLTAQKITGTLDKK